ncbi:hypothetical protein RUND412_007155 [Rhizina undulata]
MSIPIILLALVLPLNLILIPLFSHPLRKIPAAHQIAHYTRLWILWKTIFKQRNRSIHAAHQKHGPIVRLGPNEVSVSSLEGLKTIYSGSGFDKSSWYRVFENYGLPPMFSLLQTRDHSVRKRILANVYSKSAILSSPLVSASAESILLHLYDILKEVPVQEVHELFSALATDFTLAFLFGNVDGNGFIKDTLKGDLTSRKRFLKELYQSRGEYFQYVAEIPELVEAIKKASFGRMRMVPKWVDENNAEIESWVLRMCGNWESAGKNTDQGLEECVYARLFAADIPMKHRAAEVLDHIGAGHETSGVALTYITYNLSLRPKLQSELRKEISSLRMPLDPKALDKLPLLDAVVTETLRLNAPIPASQPRVVPKGGCQLHGYFLPEGTVVSSQAWTLHRNESVFPQTKEWKPERWLCEEEEKREMEKWWWAFGSGSRGCIGRNLAINEIKMTIATIYLSFETEVVDDRGIEMDDRYTIGPVRNELTLRFKKVGN